MSLTKILDDLGVEYVKSGNMAIGKCPIHNGDNITAFNLTLSGKYKGKWFCNTAHCHEKHIGINGLISALLEKKGQPPTKENIEKILDGEMSFELKKEHCEYTPLTKSSKKRIEGLSIPSQYYQSRGFSKKILETFEVGEFIADSGRHEMYNRVVFPVFQFDGSYLGCVGRTLDENYAKWKNGEGFKKSQTLYGLWKTVERVKETETIILVEGQGDFLKLYDAGVRNCAGMFSNFLCEDHINLLLHLGVHTIVLLKDNDNAGEKGVDLIKKKIKGHFHFFTPHYEGKDIGDLSVEEIKEKIIPTIKEYL